MVLFCDILIAEFYKHINKGRFTMRIAIVDDISEERTLLRNRLESQFSRRNVHIDIFEYENGETFLTAAKECPFTVVFLDIYMNGSNGIDTAKELRRSDTDCLLIFTTTSTDHALEGFQVRALHYLVKPYSENDISVLADEILSRIPDSGKYIDVKVNGSNIQIPFRKIIYAEHFSHMIHIYTAGERELVTRQSFDSFITSLKMDSRFYQCNRGVVINLEHAVDFDGSGFRLDNGSNVPVSRKLIKNARQTFMEFLFQRRS
jgi:DNA-binding LytR/AlgR family response regulator